MKRQIQIAFWSVVGFFAILALGIAAAFFDKKKAIQLERKLMAEELKQKVEKLKAQESERAAAAEKAVVQVEQETKRELSRDTVDAANDLIAGLRSDGPGKGG